MGIIWKPVVEGFRESCDECTTSLFNYHFICKMCGYSICFSCCEEFFLTKTGANEENKYVCLFCKETNPTQLTLAQIIPNGSLEDLCNEMHTLQKLWNIPLECEFS